ncbi:uncharacterized protein BCR38DRAFT_12978 [Pseudomassariella vexata]|uniref:tRNA modification GTPase TrmE n=1 Tax=Pseudomassariella vexata TaxID=1141098 RepID=A0A1Y2EIZ8_9PEZI|nr:uncharacterized protein BCR38DRAFT_12978 [Pseudomassariella vexata]ORY71562.1 hypothetical protein BCR38DRAFT_12978 [Pseudomassariella vexata]
MLRCLARGASQFLRSRLPYPPVTKAGVSSGVLVTPRCPTASLCLGLRVRNGERMFLTSAQKNDTIYALSTAQGKAGIAVIRISGPSCKTVYESLCPSKAIPKPRYAGVRTLFHPESSETNVIDSNAMVLYLSGPKTVTGEDVLELHVHGGNATVKAVLSAIAASRTRGRVRYAEPGEFTKRAFLNDRLDLAQVEALSDMLSAETEQQRRAAVHGTSGALGRIYEGWRQKLLKARAEIEAIIDFSEDQHFDDSPLDLLANVSRQVEQMLSSIEMHETASQRSELLRNGIKIALLGPPNAGKSSLMNQIVGREASIVSGEAGTTRDIVEAHLDIRGYLCTFADTAGFRSVKSVEGSGFDQAGHIIGTVEQEGIRRARSKALESDLVVVLASIEQVQSGEYMINYDSETLGLLISVGRGIVVVNKRDVLPEEELEDLIEDFQVSVLDKIKGLSASPILVSCKQARDHNGTDINPRGIDGVVTGLVQLFTDMTLLPVDQQGLHGVTERQRQLLVQCRKHLEDYVGNTTSDDAIDELKFVVAAEDLRYAANCLARITGHGESGDVEEVLGVIFEKFCVGK